MKSLKKLAVGLVKILLVVGIPAAVIWFFFFKKIKDAKGRIFTWGQPVGTKGERAVLINGQPLDGNALVSMAVRSDGLVHGVNGDGIGWYFDGSWKRE